MICGWIGIRQAEQLQPVSTTLPAPRPTVVNANTLGRLEQIAYQKYLGSPAADLLLTLVQFNVFRALLRNMFSLQLSTSWLDDVATSAITTGAFNHSAPPSLLPTTLQEQVTHHPWIDLFPFPILRENILRVYDVWNGEDELCAAMVGWCNSPGARTGLISWGEPWNPYGWEATEEFCKRYGWVMRGCSELMHATNHWRAQRGESALTFTDMH